MAAAQQQAAALSAEELEWLLRRPSVPTETATRVLGLALDAQREQVAQWLKYVTCMTRRPPCSACDHPVEGEGCRRARECVAGAVPH